MVEIKRIVFVNPFPYYAGGVNEATLYPPLGIAYLASVVEAKGVVAKVIDANILRLRNDAVFEQIKNFDPDVVAISVNIVTYRAGIELSRMVKKRLKKLVMFGGPYATTSPETVLAGSKADCVVRQEGELTIAEIIDRKGRFEGVDGVTYRKSNKIISNKDRELIEDLDSLPFPAYHLLPKIALYKSRARRVPVAPILTSRGCPYRCIYCNKSIFGFKFRARSPENIVEEIEMLANEYGARQIDVLDDNFTFNIKNAEKVLDLIIEKKLDIVISMQNGLRADRLTLPLVKKMKRAGVVKVGIGIESGSQEMIKVIKKSLDLSKVTRAIKWFRDEGIFVVGFFMLGLPGEDEDTMRKTIDFAKRVNPHLANFSIVVPLPGTELYDMVERRGGFTRPIEDGLETGFFSSSFYYTFDNLTPETVLKYQKMAYSEFYFRPSKILELVFTVKSVNELMWTINTAVNVMKGVFVKPFTGYFLAKKRAAE